MLHEIASNEGEWPLIAAEIHFLHEAIRRSPARDEPWKTLKSRKSKSGRLEFLNVEDVSNAYRPIMSFAWFGSRRMGEFQAACLWIAVWRENAIVRNIPCGACGEPVRFRRSAARAVFPVTATACGYEPMPHRAGDWRIPGELAKSYRQDRHRSHHLRGRGVAAGSVVSKEFRAYLDESMEYCPLMT